MPQSLAMRRQSPANPWVSQTLRLVKKRKSESQLEGGVSTVNPSPTPTQDDVEAPPLPKKKKTKTCTNSVDTVESSQLSTTHAMGRNSHGAPSNVKRMDNSSKKRPGDETFVNCQSSDTSPSDKEGQGQQSGRLKPSTTAPPSFRQDYLHVKRYLLTKFL